MFFTQDDYKKIQQWLIKNSVKDTEFNEANIPFNGEETITIVQGNQNKKVFLKDLIAQVFNLGISDFVNITDKYDAPNISLEEAIRLIPSRARKEGQVITFLDREDHWHIYQFKGALNQWNILDQWEDLFDWEKLIIDSILPDEEDLTKSLPDENGNSYLSLKDREYNPEDFSGLGRIILRKNIVDIEDPIYGKVKKNVLYQDMFTQSNTIYEIRYDFDLNGQEITIPEGCELEFKGGSLNNGILSLNNTSVKSEAVCFRNVVLTKDSTNGLLSEVMSSWFAEIQNAVDSASSLGVALCIDSDATISESIKIKKNFTTIHGLSSRIHIRCTEDCPIFELEKEGALNYIKLYDLHLSGGSYGIYRDYADGDSFGTYVKGGSLQVADFYNIFFEEQSKSGICIKGYGFGCINIHHNHFITSDLCKSEEPAINIEVFWANRNHINDCRFNGYFTGAIKVKCNQFIQNEIDNLWCEYIYMQLANSYAIHIEGTNVFDFVIRTSYFERLVKYGDTFNGEIPIYIYANGGPARNISIKELGISSNVVSSTWIKLKGTIVGLLVSENGSYVGETVYIDSSEAQVYSAVLLSNAILFNIISPDNFRYVDVFRSIQNNIEKISEHTSKIANFDGERDDALYRLPTGNTQEWTVDIPAKNGAYLFNVIINPASTTKIYIGTFIVQKAKDVCEIYLLKETNSSADYDYEITSVKVAVKDEVISVLATFRNIWVGSGNAIFEYKISSLLYSKL